MYADDIALISSRRLELIDAINVLKSWCQDFHMTINYKKSGIMRLNWKEKSDYALYNF